MSNSEFVPIPKEHNVVKSIYSNNALTSPYGTSAFLKILNTPSPLPELTEFLQKKKEEFLTLKDQIYRVRKQRFSKIIEDLEMCDDDEELEKFIYPSEKIRKYTLEEILLNPWISPDTFRYFSTNFWRFFREHPDNEGFNRVIEYLVKDIDSIPDKKIKKDFLLNWGLFLNYFVNEYGWKDFDIYSDNQYSKQLKKLMDEVVDKIQQAYHIDSNAFKEEGIHRIIPKGFILYRAFEKTKDVWGDLQNGMWAAVNGSDITAYITPQIEKYDENDEEIEFDNGSAYYCEKMRNLAVFRVTRDLTLLDFSNEEGMNVVYNKMTESDEKLAEIFKQRYIDERDSVKPEDQKVATWLCENGYDGYIGETGLVWFHDEVMICNQRQNLSLVEVYNGNDIGIPICEEPYKDYNFVLELL